MNVFHIKLLSIFNFSKPFLLKYSFLEFKRRSMCPAMSEDKPKLAYTQCENAKKAPSLSKSYWFGILQAIIKSSEGWGRDVMFLLLVLPFTLVLSVRTSSVY